jgi:hypothetical protein
VTGQEIGRGQDRRAAEYRTGGLQGMRQRQVECRTGEWQDRKRDWQVAEKEIDKSRNTELQWTRDWWWKEQKCKVVRIFVQREN